MLFRLLIVSLIIFKHIACCAVECEQLKWVNQPPKEDSKFKYYLGRSDFYYEYNVAIKQAVDDAYLKAVLDGFGVKGKYKSKLSFSGNIGLLIQKCNLKVVMLV